MLDESGSVTKEDWEREKNFVVKLANGFGNYGPAGIQMGVLSFSTDPHVDIKLNQYSRKEDFVSAIGQMKQFRK